jgi:hypothetical protein
MLNVGNDNLLAIAEEGVDLNWIKIPSLMRPPPEDCNLRGLIQTIYPDHQCHFGDAMYFMQRNILAPKNTNVDEVNNAILESLSEELHMYLGTNFFGFDRRRCKCCCRNFNGFIVSGGIYEHFAIQQYRKS